MKCVRRRSDDRIAQVSDLAAKLMVDSGDWIHISKNAYKRMYKALRKQIHADSKIPKPQTLPFLRIDQLRQHFRNKRRGTVQ